MHLFAPKVSSEAMQQGMPQEMQALRAGSKRRSPPTVHSDQDSDDLLFPGSPGGDHKVVQTTKSKGIVNVQLFIRKAFAMINECDPNIASWTDEGDKFVVKNKDIFAAAVIPQYYDHNNYSSFTRQLNFYGFTREQSMTIKVSDLNSLAVGQETFFHQNFQRGRPDLLKNLQRRSTDTKNSKKRKKPRTDPDVSFLHGRIENLEDTTKEMLSTMKQMRDDSYASVAAIQNLNSAKDEKISSLERRIEWLERSLTSSAIQRQESFINTTQRLTLPVTDTPSAQGLMAPAAASATSAFGIQQMQQAALLPSEVTFSAGTGTNLAGLGLAPGDGPTLTRHPRMKKVLGNPPSDIFSYQNTNVSNSAQGVAPSRETSLDFGILSSLARENTLMSWMPRQDAEPKNFP